jgi:hypothetical protein
LARAGERFRGGVDPPNEVMLLGTVVHCIFQAAVQYFDDQLKAGNKRPTISAHWLKQQVDAFVYADFSVGHSLPENGYNL